MGSEGAEDTDDPWTSITFVPGDGPHEWKEVAVPIDPFDLGVGLGIRGRIVINGNEDLKGRAQDET